MDLKSKKFRSESSKKPRTFETPQLTYLLKESSLIRTFVFAQCMMILICFLLYFTYYLFYDYLTIVIFSVISSIALRKTKDKIVLKIFDLIYSVEMSNHRNSLAYQLFFFLIDNIIHFKQNHQALIQRCRILIKSFNFTNDIYVISCIFVIYLLAFNLPLKINLGLLFLIILVEFIIRLCIDLFYYFKYKLGFYLNSLKGSDEKTAAFFRVFFGDQEKIRDIINHSVTILMIIVFFFMMIAIVLLFLALCAKDIKLFLFKSQDFIDLIMKKINDSFGLEYDSFKLNVLLTKNFEDIFNVFLNKKEVATALEFLRSFY